MNIALLRQPIESVQAQWLVLGIFEDDAEPPRHARGTALEAESSALIGEKELTGSLGELMPLYEVPGLELPSDPAGRTGPPRASTPARRFRPVLPLAKRLAAKRRESVAVVLPPSDDPPRVASALIEGAIAGTRGPGCPEERSRIATLSRAQPGRRGRTRARSELSEARTWLAARRDRRAGRQPGTRPGEHSARRKVAARSSPIASALVAADAGIAVDVWDEARIRQERFGGLLGVAAGSDEPPRFVILDYRQGGESPTLALVGKGVTFDSGGLSLKPSASMEDMKSDMTGAAVVVATMQAAARLELPVNVTGYLALTENMTGGKAMKLGDVLTMRNGKTVEIMNTDAEGRLILADALSYAVEHQPIASSTWPR